MNEPMTAGGGRPGDEVPPQTDPDAEGGSRLTRQDVLRIAELARLRLQPEEVERYTAHLGRVLDHATDLDEVDLDGLDRTWQAVPLGDCLRDDVVGTGVDRDEVLAEAPSVQDGRFCVPRILGEAP